MDLTVEGTRLTDELSTLATFSAPSEAGGVTRRAWSPEYFAAERWLVSRFADAGLAVEVDAARNVWGRWEEGALPAVTAGSHIDSVPSGGRFDGCLGVLGALEAVRALRAAGHRPARQLWLVAWMEEEGSAFDQTLFGSRAFTGELDVEDAGARTGAGGETLEQTMAAAGHQLADLVDLPGRVDDIGAYLELHIEQGPILEREDVPIGVVTDIVGIEHGRFTFTGRANHAGGTPMDLRQDASLGLARGIAEARRLAVEHGVRATTGQVWTAPGAMNVIPEHATFSLDARDRDRGSLDGYLAALTASCERIAADDGLTVAYERLHELAPVPLAGDMQQRVADAATAADARHLPLLSGAGHDAMMLAPRLPTGMIFVPSRDGVSHAPAEYTSPEQCAKGAEVLAHALAGLTGPG